MFSKILIANRGEIALRIIRACRELGIRTVAVYSETDRDSLHVRYADEDVCIGPANNSASYMHIPSIVSAAEIADVEAIHPGYGFLSENAHFAEICESCKITFIGPTPDVIRLMGDKVQAREKMKRSGVPIIPGSDTEIGTKVDALEVARRLGYPVIIKASGGGGGRGMKIAHNDVSLVSALTLAQSEAEAAFGNPSVYVEKYLERPRHVEVQVLGDTHGSVVHLGDRDCTIQRKHQKLVEECPAPGLSAKLRLEIAETAVRAARSVGYSSAGTVEFLLDEKDRFFFIEMNTRLQVEHPVTEEVTGIDLVKEQIRIATGERLGLRQRDIEFSGCAIECRINAEDPDNGFIPSPGKIHIYNPPGGPGVRVDTHVYSEYIIPPQYDSLIAKLIVRGRNRSEAIARMQWALDEFVIEGIRTTVPLHKRIINHPDFARGGVRGDFIEQLLEHGVS